jgi:hypothetical protein
MKSTIISVCEDLGATARARSEALAARGLFISGVMQQSYRLWLILLSTEFSEALKAAQDLATCKTPAEVAEVQAAWFQAMNARAISSLQGSLEIANFLIRNLQDDLTSFATPTLLATPSVTPRALPALTVPLALAAPVVIEVASAPVVIEVASAPVVIEVASAPAAGAPEPVEPPPVVAAPAIPEPVAIEVPPAPAASAPEPVEPPPVVAAPVIPEPVAPKPALKPASKAASAPAATRPGTSKRRGNRTNVE